MILRPTLLIAAATCALLSGCATTEEPVSQKERDRMTREMEKMNRKQTQEQNKALRDPTSTQQRRMR